MPLFVRHKIEKEDFQKSQAKFSKACKPQAKNQSLQSSLPKGPKLQNITAFFMLILIVPHWQLNSSTDGLLPRNKIAMENIRAVSVYSNMGRETFKIQIEFSWFLFYLHIIWMPNHPKKPWQHFRWIRFTNWKWASPMKTQESSLF